MRLSSRAARRRSTQRPAATARAQRRAKRCRRDAPKSRNAAMGPRAAHHLSGLVSGLAVLPLEPERPALAALGVGFCVVVACTLLFDPIGRAVLFRKASSLHARHSHDDQSEEIKNGPRRAGRIPATVATAKDKTPRTNYFRASRRSAWNLIFNVGPQDLGALQSALRGGRWRSLRETTTQVTAGCPSKRLYERNTTLRRLRALRFSVK